MYCTPCNGTLKLFSVYHSLEKKLFLKNNLRIMNSFVGPFTPSKKPYGCKTRPAGTTIIHCLEFTQFITMKTSWAYIIVVACSNHTEPIVPAAKLPLLG